MSVFSLALALEIAFAGALGFAAASEVAAAASNSLGAAVAAATAESFDLAAAVALFFLVAVIVGDLLADANDDTCFLRAILRAISS